MDSLANAETFSLVLFSALVISESCSESSALLKLWLKEVINEFSLAMLSEAEFRLASALVWTDCNVDSEAEAVLRSLS